MAELIFVIASYRLTPVTALNASPRHSLRESDGLTLYVQNTLSSLYKGSRQQLGYAFLPAHHRTPLLRFTHDITTLPAILLYQS